MARRERGAGETKAAGAREEGNHVSDYWYLNEASARVGPVSVQELKRLYQQNQVNVATQVWRDGLGGWRPLGQVFRLAAPVATAGQAQSAQPAPAPLTVSPPSAASPVPPASVDLAGGVAPGSSAGVALSRPSPETAPAPAPSALVSALPSRVSVRQLLRETFSPNQLHEFLRSVNFWVLVGLAAAPLLLASLDPDTFILWMFFYFSMIWALVLHRVIQPEPGTWKLAVWAYLGTGLLAIPLLIAWLSLPPHLTDTMVVSQNPLQRLFGFVFGVGPREEVTKWIPVAVILLVQRRANRPLSLRQGLFLGVVSGLAFAGRENFGYFLAARHQEHLALIEQAAMPGQSLHLVLVRVMVTPFLHGAWAAIVAFFAAWSEIERGGRWRLLASGLIAGALLHGAYDWSLGLDVIPLPLLSIAFTMYVLLRCCARAEHARDVRKHLDVRLG
jgi:RsiW-degrading membrane proteinase PrsW (M82 family)